MEKEEVSIFDSAPPSPLPSSVLPLAKEEEEEEGEKRGDEEVEDEEPFGPPKPQLMLLPQAMGLCTIVSLPL